MMREVYVSKTEAEGTLAQMEGVGPHGASPGQVRAWAAVLEALHAEREAAWSILERFDLGPARAECERAAMIGGALRWPLVLALVWWELDP